MYILVKAYSEGLFGHGYSADYDLVYRIYQTW